MMLPSGTRTGTATNRDNFVTVRDPIVAPGASSGAGGRVVGTHGGWPSDSTLRSCTAARSTVSSSRSRCARTAAPSRSSVSRCRSSTRRPSGSGGTPATTSSCRRRTRPSPAGTGTTPTPAPCPATRLSPATTPEASTRPAGSGGTFPTPVGGSQLTRLPAVDWHWAHERLCPLGEPWLIRTPTDSGPIHHWCGSVPPQPPRPSRRAMSVEYVDDDIEPRREQLGPRDGRASRTRHHSEAAPPDKRPAREGARTGQAATPHRCLTRPGRSPTNTGRARVGTPEGNRAWLRPAREGVASRPPARRVAGCSRARSPLARGVRPAPERSRSRLADPAPVRAASRPPRERRRQPRGRAAPRP